jgi:NAD(P)-dependent dehydrogenase (short-subunit alcohol dehydrogenase family)
MNATDVNGLAPEARPPGRVAVITGASRGLGLALARGLAADGYRLVVDARDGAALRTALAGLPGPPVTVLPGDITHPAHRDELRRAAAELGGPDLLINNAGTLGAAPLPAMADYPPAALRDAFEVNVIAPLALTQSLLPGLRAHGGAVLSITSDAAVEPYAGWGGYGAAKAALEQACAVLAAEETTVRVWWVDPGDLRTDMHQQAFPGEDISDRPLPETVVPAFRRLIAERMPSGRYRASDLLPATPVPAVVPSGDPAPPSAPLPRGDNSRQASALLPQGDNSRQRAGGSAWEPS